MAIISVSSPSFHSITGHGAYSVVNGCTMLTRMLVTVVADEFQCFTKYSEIELAVTMFVEDDIIAKVA